MATTAIDQHDIEIALGQLLDSQNLLQSTMATAAEVTRLLLNVNLIISAAIANAAFVTVDDGAAIGAIAQTS